MISISKGLLSNAMRFGILLVLTERRELKNVDAKF
jgi:hypothetical protein